MLRGTSVLLDAVLWQRHLLTAGQPGIAARCPAERRRPAAGLRRTRGIATAADDVQVFVWKQFKYRLLVALDRPTDLETALRGWIEPADGPTTTGGRALGYILAEQGRLTEADRAVRADRGGATSWARTDYRALAGWYLAVAGPRQARSQSRV